MCFGLQWTDVALAIKTRRRSTSGGRYHGCDPDLPDPYAPADNVVVGLGVIVTGGITREGHPTDTDTQHFAPAAELGAKGRQPYPNASAATTSGVITSSVDRRRWTAGAGVNSAGAADNTEQAVPDTSGWWGRVSRRREASARDSECHRIGVARRCAWCTGVDARRQLT